MRDTTPTSRSDDPSPTRRAVLAAAGGGLTLLAGCNTGPSAGDGNGSDTNGSTNGTTGTTDANTTGNGSGGTSTPERDDLETNVSGLFYSSEGRSYTFRVTVERERVTDIGYVEGIVVETAGGDPLGEKSFDGPGPSTRKASFEVNVPEGVTRVVARGVDSLNGRGGVAMATDLDSKAIDAVDQGPEPRSFEDYTVEG
ncbi:hypothetical protein [Halomarina litorea]|uniref:hypothetical protein n=1 Tax=Halomarina litorea TaxID=2961595 RepID=UPI0020C538F2|nr:hypothetical protein [Halomarina sp. BCD28]